MSRLGRPVRLAAFVWVAIVALLAPSTGSAQSPTMRERIYDRLSKAQTATEAGDYPKALELLREVEKDKNLSPYEIAQFQTAYGFLEYTRENYREAVKHYEIALQQEGLPEAMTSLTLYTLAQMNFMIEDYQAAADGLLRWLQTATSPGPEPYVLLGQAYYKLGRYRDGLTAVQNAIEIAQTGGRPIQEGWYLLLRVLHYELGDWKKVAEVLQILVERFPKKEYWLQLAATYGEMDDNPKRLATYDAAYLQGLLDDDQDLLAYSQLLVQAGAPYRGAVVLAKAMEDSKVEKTERHLRLLSEMWTVAREEEKAIAALEATAQVSTNGEADARLAQLHLNRDELDLAVKSGRRALEKGVEDPAQIRLVLGMALFEAERYDQARTEFRQAQSDPDLRTAATQWIDYIDREVARIRQLEEGLAAPAAVTATDEATDAASEGS